MKLIYTKILLVLIFGNWFSSDNEIHPLKLSTCVITCSPASNEILLNFHFFQDDFGEHLSKLTNKEINLDVHSQETNNLIQKYVKDHFEFTIDDDIQTLHWKNAYKEDIVEHVEFIIQDCHCELPKHIHVKNTLMLDVFEKQSNLVRIDLKGDKNFKTLRFNKDETEISVLLK